MKTLSSSSSPSPLPLSSSLSLSGLALSRPYLALANTSSPSLCFPSFAPVVKNKTISGWCFDTIAHTLLDHPSVLAEAYRVVYLNEALAASLRKDVWRLASSFDDEAMAHMRKQKERVRGSRGLNL